MLLTPDGCYLYGYMVGIQARHPRKLTLGHWLTLRREHASRWVKNWRYHLLRQRKPLSPEAKANIAAVGRGFDDGLEGRVA